MRVWIVQAQENPAGARSEAGRRAWRSNALSETLADRGHDVIRWRSSFSHQAKIHLVQGSQRAAHDNYAHQFIDAPAYRRHIGMARIRNHQALSRNFLKIARADPDPPALIHVGNVPIALCHAAVRFGIETGTPVVVDIRDLWPDIYVDFIPDRLAALRAPALHLLTLSARRLKWSFARATAITALTQSFLDWGLKKAGRAQGPDDAIVPMCYPRPDRSAAPETVAALRARLGIGEQDVVASYIGNVGFQSDYETVIEAARRLADRHPQFKVVIAGSGPRVEPLRALAADLSGVILPGWLQGPDLQALMAVSQIGLVAYKPVPNYLRNLPNKFPEYLAGGLAIACGLEGEMGRLTREADCGFVYGAGDAGDLAGQLDAILRDPARLAAMGERARALHRAQFDSAGVYPAFADHLETVARRHAPRVV